CELLGADAARPNLVARLGSGPGAGAVEDAGPRPRLCYLGHVDTVLADPSEWTHDPWSGDVADGFIWGRGALGMKAQVAADGAAGHAPRPAMGENALLKMAPALPRLGAHQPAYHLTDEPRALLRGLGEDPADPAGAIAHVRAADPRLAVMFEPMLGVTFTPTRIRASEKINVIPSRAELRVDCRVPPGLGEEEVRKGIAEVLGENGF